ncbi:MAG: hypothetical protein LBM02_03980 [Lachnospiraceae bacterium]|jgi:hypothetical protein|nr:hypothetical protein [Lachnospiraceae bacterium]
MPDISLDTITWEQSIKKCSSKLSLITKAPKQNLKKTNLKKFTEPFQQIEDIGEVVEEYKKVSDVYIKKMQGVGDNIIDRDDQAAASFLSNIKKVKWK